MQKYNVSNVDEIASIASAASTVMTYLFPNATSSIIQLQNSYTPMGLSANNSTFVKSVRLGHYIGQRIVMSAQHDELANEFHGHMPKGPCTWKGINPGRILEDLYLKIRCRNSAATSLSMWL
jgi:hypothetical protein